MPGKFKPLFARSCGEGEVSVRGGTEHENVISGDIIASTVLGTQTTSNTNATLLTRTVRRVQRGRQVSAERELYAIRKIPSELQSGLW